MREIGDVPVETLTTLADAETLVPAWRALADACPWATTFQRPEWVLAFLRSSRASPRIVVVGRRSTPVGIVPLASGPEPGMWTLAGTGPSDVLDLVAAPGDEIDVTRAALTHLATREDWDVLELHELRDECALRRAAREVPLRIAADTPLSVCPRIGVGPSARVLEDVVPTSIARRARRDARRAEREGLRIEVATGERASEAIDAWIATHGARWAARGEDGALRAAEELHRSAAGAILAGGLGELVCLRDRAGVIRATYLVLVERRATEARISFYLGGFDPAIAARSPLVLAIATTIERHVARGGLREVDFLRGAEPYKRSWGAVDRVQHRLRLERVLA